MDERSCSDRSDLSGAEHACNCVDAKAFVYRAGVMARLIEEALTSPVAREDDSALGTPCIPECQPQVFPRS